MYKHICLYILCENLYLCIRANICVNILVSFNISFHMCLNFICMCVHLYDYVRMCMYVFERFTCMFIYVLLHLCSTCIFIYSFACSFFFPQANDFWTVSAHLLIFVGTFLKNRRVVSIYGDCWNFCSFIVQWCVSIFSLFTH